MANRQRNSAKPARAKKPGAFGVLAKLLLVVFIILTLPVGYFAAKIYQSSKDMPDIAVLEKYEPIEAIQIFDKNDHLICTVEGDEDRRVVPLAQISTQMQQAMLAAEDHHFYEHHGINPLSIFRAFLANMQAHRVVEGGSTITQQLIKNLFFGDEGRTFDRKVKEAFLSYEIERRYSKDRILEMYLNQVYFGNGGYGIERAAQRYFDRSAAGLDLAQAAFLAGLVKAPSEYGNPVNRKPAIARQHEIISRMVEFGYITRDQADRAIDEKLVFKKGVNPLQNYPFYVSYVLEQLRARFSESEMRRQGLKVYTNLDPLVQKLAEKTLNEDLKKAPKGVSQAALVCISVKDGAVLALVGGVGNFWQNQYNRATNPHTAGSSFKPFVYLTAFLNNVFRPDSIIEDSPLTIKQGWGLPDWSPKNFDHKFMGRITVRKALCLSRNVPAVKIGRACGIDHVIETARLAGINSRLDANLSLSLGSSAVTPLDMAGAYATFARMGVAIKPQVLRRIDNNRGQVIEVFEPRVDKVFDSESVARLVDVMQDVVRVGTGTAARLADRPVAGKTGTADAGKDIWFCGFTPDTVCTLWGGNDENLPIAGHNVTGGVVMAKIWKDFMTAYYQLHPTPAGAFMVATKKPEPLVGEEGGNAAPVDSAMPNLVPITPGSDAPADSNAESVRPNEGSAPPAISPTNSLPFDQSPPLQSVPAYPYPAPSVVPTNAMPAPAAPPPPMPLGQLPNAPSVVPVLGTAAPGSRVAPTIITGDPDNRPRRTIINEGSARGYYSISDPNLSPGLHGRRFAPSSGTRGSDSPGF